MDADFIILPMANYDAGQLNEILERLERDHNATLFRRGMKDHILPGLQNTRKSYGMANLLSNRSHELATPMIKFVVDIWCVVRSSHFLISPFENGWIHITSLQGLGVFFLKVSHLYDTKTNFHVLRQNHDSGTISG